MHSILEPLRLWFYEQGEMGLDSASCTYEQTHRQMGRHWAPLSRGPECSEWSEDRAFCESFGARE